MLVLSRQRDESIFIGDNIKITVVDIRGDKVRLGIQAPTEIPVHRQEVYEAIRGFQDSPQEPEPVPPEAKAPLENPEHLKTIERQKCIIQRQNELIRHLEMLIQDFRQTSKNDQ